MCAASQAHPDLGQQVRERAHGGGFAGPAVAHHHDAADLGVDDVEHERQLHLLLPHDGGEGEHRPRLHLLFLRAWGQRLHVSAQPWANEDSTASLWACRQQPTAQLVIHFSRFTQLQLDTATQQMHPVEAAGWTRASGRYLAARTSLWRQAPPLSLQRCMHGWPAA